MSGRAREGPNLRDLEVVAVIATGHYPASGSCRPYPALIISAAVLAFIAPAPGRAGAFHFCQSLGKLIPGCSQKGI